MAFTIRCIPERIIRNVGNRYWFWMSEYMLKRINKLHPLFKIIVTENKFIGSDYINLGTFKIYKVNEHVKKTLKGNRKYLECVIERV